MNVATREAIKARTRVAMILELALAGGELTERELVARLVAKGFVEPAAIPKKEGKTVKLSAEGWETAATYMA